ncbi:MAG: recombinase family protein [Streptococcus suis]
MKQTTEKYTILYARLSQDDGSQGESNSISNQRLMLEKYANDNGFENLKFMADDGYSGTNFNRPAFKEMMELVENDEVETIIVKDMSRFGREYLEVGKYTEIIFPNYDVRFIAIGDNIDSLYGVDDFAPFKNIINELYAKDCSRKIRAANRAKAETGARVGTNVPFGYMKDPEDPKRKLVPDPESAEIVKYIFQLCVEGNGPSRIASRLSKEKIFMPNYYWYSKGMSYTKTVDLSDPYRWQQTTVRHILENEVYLGHTINLKTTTKSFKNKKKIEIPKEDHLRFENTHTALITQKVWDIVQDIRQHKRRRTNMDEQDMFSGVVYCKDCGAKMVLHRAQTMKESQYNFMCGTYKKKGKEVCTAHFIKEDQLAKVILDDLKRVTHYARQHETMFAEIIAKKNSKESQKEMTMLVKEIDTLRRRDNELTALFKRLYEDNVLGKIPNEIFRKLSDDYLKEQKEIQSTIPEKERRLEKLKSTVANVTAFIEEAKAITDIKELTATLLHRFIDKIVIGERTEKYSRTAMQEIQIHYRYIGLLDKVIEDAAEKECKSVA